MSTTTSYNVRSAFSEKHVISAAEKNPSYGLERPAGTKDGPQWSGTVGGLSVLSAAMFVGAEMAGTGILAMPKAVVDCGWIGLVLFIVFCINSAYGGTRLSICWDIVEERYPEYRGRTRNPYPVIAYVAVGNWGSALIRGCLQFTLFGVCTVNLLLAAQTVQTILGDIVPGISYCIWFLIFGVIMTPFMWLGSPKDFWLVAVGALLATAAACVLIFTQTVREGLENSAPVPHGFHSPTDFFKSFGTILFAYGGVSTFPTIQNDMVHREKFFWSVSIGFSLVLVQYGPVVFAGFFVFGDNVNANILMSLSGSGVATAANIMMAIHLILAFLILANPISQDLEQILKVPHRFGWKRCVLRSCMVLFMICVGETIPDFDKILALVGGSTVTLATFILPPLFYMRLCDQKNEKWIDRPIPVYMRVYMWLLILIGVVGGLCSTYSALIDIFSAASFTKPCYWPNHTVRMKFYNYNSSFGSNWPFPRRESGEKSKLF